MNSLKFSLVQLLLIVFLCSNSFSTPSFTYSGPTTVTIPYGQNSVQATYYFTYYGLSGLHYPCLIVSLDGNVISNDLCNNPTTPSSFAITFTQGSHTVQFSLLSVNSQTLDCHDPVIWQVNQFSVQAKFKVRTENIFSGGTLYVDNLTTPKSAPYDRTSYTGDNFQIGAIDQSSGGHNWIWNNSGTYNSKWEKIRNGSNPIDYSNDRNTSYIVQSNDNSTRLKAGLRKICLIDFQNSFVGVGNGGIIKVNGVQYNSPKLDVPVTELNSVTAQPLNQVLNGIQYIFTQWNDSSTTTIRTFYPDDSNTYSAYYTGKPLSFSVMNTHFNDIPGQNVITYWNDHPNTNVTQYQIWRIVKHNGVTGSPELLATKNRGTTSYTDRAYTITSGYTDDLLWYDVRPYYSTENTYADPYWLAIFGSTLTKSSDSTVAKIDESKEFTVSCFPNPFNPVTNIRASIPSDGLLQVVIYSILGEKILELENSIVTKGTYNYLWNGVDASSNTVNSGIYIVLVKTDTKIITQKILLLK